jgi:hypothetical protein
MESVNYQTLFNVAIGAVSMFGGYFLKSMTDSLKDLAKADGIMLDKVHALETVVIGEYVHRDNLKDVAAVLFEKLDKIDAKLDRKTDKEFCQNFHRPAQ